MNEIVIANPQHPVRAPRLDIQALGTLALEKGAGADVIERLYALKKAEQAEWAKAQFDDAMARFQSLCKPIVKDTPVEFKNKIAYRYAKLEDIEQAIRPVLKECGFHHTFDTEIKDGFVTAKCIITHVDGHQRENKSTFPLTTKTQLMSPAQQYAATLTFARRYALMCAYDLVVVGEDNNGAEEQEEKGPEQVSQQDDRAEWDALRKELWTVMKPVRGAQSNWVTANQWLYNEEILDGGIPEVVPNISVARFRQVIAAVKQKLEQHQ